MPKFAMQTPKFALNTETTRLAAQHFDEDAVLPCYRDAQEKLVTLLNQALATELVCTLRYKRHYYTVCGSQHARIRAEFLEHAMEEQRHADLIAERIVLLDGRPDFNPANLLAHSHVGYDDSYAVQEMVMANLIAERTSIEAYRQMIISIGDIDPATTRMLLGIMANEETHADDMRSFLR